jgi:membrane associated rhomboid family serine protease
MPEEQHINTNNNQTDEFYFGFVTWFFPMLFVFCMWLVYFMVQFLDIPIREYGVMPLKIEGLRGVLTSPFMHANLSHLFDNSFPLLFLLLSLFYFYRQVAWPVLWSVYIITGLFIWFFGRPSYHIGASGLVYGLAAYLFFSGIIRQYSRLIAISLIVVVLYGSLIWGIFPHKVEMSWEGHFGGGLAGWIMAILTRNYGPIKPEIIDDEEEEEIKSEE